MDSESDDDFGILKPALGTQPLPDDFDPDKAPETGEEYLHHVMYEAKKLKSWVTVDIDRNKFQNKQTFKLDMIDDHVTAPQTILPNASWQNKQIEDFDAFRSYLENFKHPNPVKDICSNKIVDTLKAVKPTFSEINALSQGAKKNLLFYSVSILDDIKNGSPLPETLAVWLFAIFATLEIPLSPEICYFLRDIARCCRRLRSHLSADAEYEMYVPYNLIICLVGRYFKQFDLADAL